MSSRYSLLNIKSYSNSQCPIRKYFIKIWLIAFMKSTKRGVTWLRVKQVEYETDVSFILLDILKQVRLQLMITTLHPKWYKWHLFLEYLSAWVTFQHPSKCDIPYVVEYHACFTWLMGNDGSAHWKICQAKMNICLKLLPIWWTL